MNIQQFDMWLEASGPVAVTVRERLEPVQGKDGVFFPPTFAPPEEEKSASPGYVIDEIGSGAEPEKTVLVDSVGAQANRLEPLFKQPPYSDLVPKATVRIGEREVDLLDAGHRAADAVVRFSDRGGELRQAFLAIRDNRNAVPLAKLAPTSLVFGVWDSRDTQVKQPRLVGSTIRAYGIEKLTRSAQFFAATEKEDIAELASQDFLSAAGLDDAPAGRTNGGVMARKEIRREAVLNLIALRSLRGQSEDETKKLQRYVLGLALCAIASQPERFLREGCLLVPADGGAQMELVERTGKRTALELTEDEARDYAQAAAASFGVGEGWTARFDPAAVKNAASAKADKKEKDKAKKSK